MQATDHVTGQAGVGAAATDDVTVGAAGVITLYWGLKG